MELQADLVAVSLTGSDALIHALYKLNVGRRGVGAPSFANSEVREKRSVTDLFAVQKRITEKVRQCSNDPDYGEVAPLPRTSRDEHRVFKTSLAQPPRMWSTHPADAEREQNAKRRYVAAAIDGRSAWELFREPQALKERMSAHVQRKAETQSTPSATTLENLEKFYGRAYLDRRYQGTYLNRSPMRYVRTTAELYGPPPAGEELLRSLASLYPASLADEMEQLAEKLEQKSALEALRDQVAQAAGGIIRHNGEELRRSDLPRAIAVLEREIAGVRASIETHDKRCRSAHLGAANTLQKGWPEYLQGIAAVLHYADHTEANLRDVNGYVINIYNVVTADGRVSSSELTRLLGGCQELYSSLDDVFRQASMVTLDRTLLRRLEVENSAGHARRIQAAAAHPGKHQQLAQRHRRLDVRGIPRPVHIAQCRARAIAAGRGPGGEIRPRQSCTGRCAAAFQRAARLPHAAAGRWSGRGRSGSTGGTDSRPRMEWCRPSPAPAWRSALSVASSCWARTSASRPLRFSTRCRRR